MYAYFLGSCLWPAVARPLACVEQDGWRDRARAREADRVSRFQHSRSREKEEDEKKIRPVSTSVSSCFSS